MQLSGEKTRHSRHSITIFGGQIHIGLFRSAPARVRSFGDIASTANRLLSGVDALSFEAGSSNAEIRNERNFEIYLPVAGLKSRFQWRFFGVIRADNSSVIVQGAFGLPHFFKIYFVMWLVAAGLCVTFGTVVAVASGLLEMWLLPLAGLIIAAGGYATLFVGRAIAEPAMQRVASQLDRSIRSGSGNTL